MSVVILCQFVQLQDSVATIKQWIDQQYSKCHVWLMEGVYSSVR